jgi:hypothetical protein
MFSPGDGLSECVVTFPLLVFAELSERARRARVRRLLCVVCHSSPVIRLGGCMPVRRPYECSWLEAALAALPCEFPGVLVLFCVLTGIGGCIGARVWISARAPVADLPESSVS